MRCLLVPDEMSAVSNWPSLHAGLNRHFDRHHEHNARGFNGGVWGNAKVARAAMAPRAESLVRGGSEVHIKSQLWGLYWP